jgi:hypothetical protein
MILNYGFGANRGESGRRWGEKAVVKASAGRSPKREVPRQYVLSHVLLPFLHNCSDYHLKKEKK